MSQNGRVDQRLDRHLDMVEVAISNHATLTCDLFGHSIYQLKQPALGTIPYAHGRAN